MNKIFELTKIFVKNSYQNFNIIDEKTKKLNKKSAYLWMVTAVFLAILYISYQAIKYLVATGEPELFLNVYLLILSLIFIIQTILVCTNIFYFSKDLEYILPLPIKPTELLMAKFFTLITTLYVSEMIFGLIPLAMYGLLTDGGIIYGIYMIILLIIFPVLFALFIGIIMMFIMKLSRFIKNKDIFQIVVTFILLSVIFGLESKALSEIFITGEPLEQIEQAEFLERLRAFNVKLTNMNRYFLVINPSVNILSGKNNLYALVEFLKIISLNIIGFILFFIVGKLTYLKNILKSTASLTRKKLKEINLEKKCKKRKIRKSYISKEFKTLFKNPLFFMQCVYPVFTVLIMAVIIIVIMLPIINEALQDEKVREELGTPEVNTELITIIIGIIQVIYTISSASITAISRDGQSATFIKYVPIKLYKQFVYKNIPQICINTIVPIVVLGLVYYIDPSMPLQYIVGMFAVAMLLNIINSYLMVIVDLRRPRINWDTEYAVVKQNNNKIFQYTLTVVIIAILVCIKNFFEKMDIMYAIYFMSAFFGIILIIIDRIVKIKQNKLFNKLM